MIEEHAKKALGLLQSSRTGMRVRTDAGWCYLTEEIWVELHADEQWGFAGLAVDSPPIVSPGVERAAQLIMEMQQIGLPGMTGAELMAVRDIADLLSREWQIQIVE